MMHKISKLQNRNIRHFVTFVIDATRALRLGVDRVGPGYENMAEVASSNRSLINRKFLTTEFSEFFNISDLNFRLVQIAPCSLNDDELTLHYIVR